VNEEPDQAGGDASQPDWLVRVGQAVAAAGSVLLLISYFLTWSDFDGQKQSLWDLLKHGDKIMTGVAIASLVMAVLSIFFVPRVLLVLSLSLGGFALGQFLPLESFEFVKAGQYVAIVAAAAIVAGSLLALLRLLIVDVDVQSEGLRSTPASRANPAGWYHDPSGQAKLRYWNGSAWTDQTQS
jgi:hypothetical protein